MIALWRFVLRLVLAVFLGGLFYVAWFELFVLGASLDPTLPLLLTTPPLVTATPLVTAAGFTLGLRIHVPGALAFERGFARLLVAVSTGCAAGAFVVSLLDPTVTDAGMFGGGALAVLGLAVSELWNARALRRRGVAARAGASSDRETRPRILLPLLVLTLMACLLFVSVRLAQPEMAKGGVGVIAPQLSVFTKSRVNEIEGPDFHWTGKPREVSETVLWDGRTVAPISWNGLAAGSLVIRFTPGRIHVYEPSRLSGGYFVRQVE
jgi:hypothetical protein